MHGNSCSDWGPLGSQPQALTCRAVHTLTRTTHTFIQIDSVSCGEPENGSRVGLKRRGAWGLGLP
eukprot:9347455-Alexandrium_andersonii.AAC.1